MKDQLENTPKEAFQTAFDRRIPVRPTPRRDNAHIFRYADWPICSDFFRHSIPSGQFSSKKNNIKNYTLNKWKFQHFCAKVGYLNCVWKGKLKEPKHGQGLFEKSETPSFRPQTVIFSIKKPCQTTV
jgi:hypothetical protein